MVRLTVAEPPAVNVAAGLAAASEKSLPSTRRCPTAVLVSGAAGGAAVAVTDNGIGPTAAAASTEMVRVAVSPGWICCGENDGVTPDGIGTATASTSDLPVAVPRNAAEEIV